MKLSVIIVNYNVRYFVEQCIVSVQRATEGMDCEIFVVDNDSSDGSIDYLKERFHDSITLIESNMIITICFISFLHVIGIIF